MANEEKKAGNIPGLDDLLGLSGSEPADLAAYRRLQALKKSAELSDEQLAAGFEDLLARRQAATKVKSFPAARWGAVAAAVGISVFAGFWLLRGGQADTPIVVEGAPAADRTGGALKTHDTQLVSARVEDLDLRIRGVNGLTAKSDSAALNISLQSGFLEANYHPGEKRKKLTIAVGDTRFFIVGTRFFVQAMAGQVSLVVSEGKVGVERQGKTYDVSAGNTWSDKTESVMPVTEQQLVSYTKKFEDMKTPVTEIQPVAKEAPKPTEKPKSRTRVILKLGQVISGTLVGEDAEAIVLKTAQGRELRIARSEIEKIERGR
ncbi:MAG: FecR domain-containing protein [Turneriella sp.]|nr:FecR domain-containing protein [Turneriella sp.]